MSVTYIDAIREAQEKLLREDDRVSAVALVMEASTDTSAQVEEDL